MYNRLNLLPKRLQEKNDTQYAYWICTILVLLAAFRSDSVGADTAGYREDYLNMGMYDSLQGLIDRYSEFYMGYFALSKLFYMVGLPVQVWFGFIMAFYLYAMMRLINMFSKDKVFSLLVFITIGLWSFSMAGLKQTFAMSMMLLACVFFIEKKYFWTTVLIVLIYYTHQVALIGIAFIPLYYIRKTKWFVPLTFVVCCLIYAYSFMFMESMVQIMGNEKWKEYLVNESSYSYVTFIFYTIITGIAFLNFRKYGDADENAKFFLGLSMIGCGLQLLAGVSPSLFRLALLYTPYMTILIPNSVYYSNNKMIKCLLMGCLIFYFLYTGRNNTYSFV